MRVIAPELLAHATDEELEWYVAALAQEADVETGQDGPWVLQERQQVAEDALAGLDPTMSHELLYGGAAGPGKSEWLLWHLYDKAIRYPGFRALFLRRTYAELRRSAIIRSLERFDRNKARYVITEFTWKFRNGSFIEFGYCETDTDVYQYQSAEYDCVAWDELTQWPTDKPYKYLFSRCRSRASLLARGYVPHIIAATNPGGVGGGWVKARFVDTGPPEQRTIHRLELPGQRADRYGSRIFIPGLLADNAYIDQDSYIANLANLDEDLVLALLDGSWDVIEGQYFPEWNKHLHVIVPFEVPHWWTRVGGIDYGHTKPWCSLEAAFDQDGTGYVYREHYKAGLVPSQQCETIKNAMQPGERVSYRVGDPSMWAQTGIGLAVAAQYRANGVPIHKALNARVAGWARVREYLRVVEDDHGDARAGIYIFDTCPNLIRTLPMLVRDLKRPEDCDTDGEDHAPDALRYLLMARPPRSRPPRLEPSTLEERLAANRRERERARRNDRVHAHPVIGDW